MKFVLIFLLALILRAVPEFLSGKYPVGFDVISGYIPALLALPDVSPMVLFGWAYSPLAIYLLWFIRFVTGLDVYLLLKVAAPIFYGLFNVCFCYMLSRGLEWNNKKSFIVSLILLLQPAIMRMGWDQLREELGLIFLFLLLAITKMDLIKGAKNRPIMVAGLSVLIVLSHQLAAILLFVATLYQIINATIKKQIETQYTITTIFPAATIFAMQIYMTYFTEPNYSAHFVPIHLADGIGSFMFTNYFLSDVRFLDGSYWTILSYVGCLSAYVFGFLILVSIKGFFRDKVWTPIVVWLLLTSFSIVIYPWFAFAQYWWWILLLPIPLTIYGGEGLEKLKVFSNQKRLKIAITGIMLLSIVSFGYASSIIKIGYPYGYYYIPSGLVESSVPLEDIQDIKYAFQWVNNNIPVNSVVVVPEKLQGLAYIELREDLLIRVLPPLLTLNNEYFPENIYTNSSYAIDYSNKVDSSNFSGLKIMEFEKIAIFKIIY